MRRKSFDHLISGMGLFIGAVTAQQASLATSGRPSAP
jgi:hypothetical protein